MGIFLAKMQSGQKQLRAGRRKFNLFLPARLPDADYPTAEIPLDKSFY
jgi:hypothetical protein